MEENILFDKKSLRSLTKNNPDWDEIAKDCVCFANASGGCIVFGIEDKEIIPPPSQLVNFNLLTILQKQIQGRTVNVSVATNIVTHENGGQYIELVINRNQNSIASTSKGAYYIRVNDSCKPLLPDELPRLMTDRAAFNWEISNHLNVKSTDYDALKFNDFITVIRNSSRVSDFVKQKNDEELKEYFFLSLNGFLTNLGVLWIGKTQDRGRLPYSPSVQFIKYNEQDEKIKKVVWDDYRFNPKELIEQIWNEIPEFKEGIEISDGIFRKQIKNYDEIVIRELLANALVHRPYTIRGDIFINMYPDRIEIVNPGSLPIGVTSKNILHKSVQRNEHLSKLFYYLSLMEKEGSGYDKVYEILLNTAKPLPIIVEGSDSVCVIVKNRVTNKDVLRWMDVVNKEFQLKQKELISLGLIAQNTALTAVELCNLLGLSEEKILNWLGNLIEYKLVAKRGKTKGVVYFVDPKLLIKHNFNGKTNLKLIEQPRLRALIVEDLSKYPRSLFGSIHHRIGKEIPQRIIRTVLKNLEVEQKIKKEGAKRFTYYSIDDKGQRQ